MMFWLCVACSAGDLDTDVNQLMNLERTGGQTVTHCPRPDPRWPSPNDFSKRRGDRRPTRHEPAAMRRNGSGRGFGNWHRYGSRDRSKRLRHFALLESYFAASHLVNGGEAVKRRLTVIASIICIIGGLAFAQQPSAAPPKIAVLIVTGQNGHNWRGTTPLLRKILEDTGKFEVRVTEEFRGTGPETLAPYDLVVLNYFERGRPELRWGDRANSAFLDFVRSGKGVVVYHFSMAAFDGWTEYEKLSAGNWRPNNGHHSAPHDFVVDIKDQEHPITKGLKLSFPQPHDELYGNLRWQPAGAYHVLAT